MWGRAARRGMRATRAVLLFSVLVVLSSSPAAAQNAEPYMLHIQTYKYLPDPLSVPAGAQVFVMSFPDPDKTTNETEPHTVTASKDPALFDVQQVPADGSAHPFRAPDAPGEYPYYCRYHGDKEGNGMVGTLIVTAAAASTTPTGTPSAAPTTSPTATPSATPADGNGTPLPAMLALIATPLAALLRRRSAR